MRWWLGGREWALQRISRKHSVSHWRELPATSPLKPSGWCFEKVIHFLLLFIFFCYCFILAFAVTMNQSHGTSFDLYIDNCSYVCCFGRLWFISRRTFRNGPLASCLGFNTEMNGPRPGSERSSSTGIKLVASPEEGFDSKGQWCWIMYERGWWKFIKNLDMFKVVFDQNLV